MIPFPPLDSGLDIHSYENSAADEIVFSCWDERHETYHACTGTLKPEYGELFTF